MLSPDYLQHCTDDIVELYRRYEDSLIQDMARRLVKLGVTETSLWQIRMYQEAGGVFDDAMKRMAELSGVAQKELTRVFQEAGAQTLAFDNSVYERAGLEPIPLRQSPVMLQILTAGLSKTNANIHNLTGTTAVTAQQAFIQASNLAYMQVAGGGMSYQQAIIGALHGLAEEGLHVLYPTGHKDKVDVAVRRNVLTGVNQTAAQLQLENARQVGSTFVETTAHFGARPSHHVWQGRVFHIGGAMDGFEDFESATGYGTGAGLCGWNCRHGFYPFIPGVSTLNYTPEQLEDMQTRTVTFNGREMPEYEATQAQRRMERDIRATKRVLLADEEAIQTATELAKQRVEAADHSIIMQIEEAKKIDALKQAYQRDSQKLKKQMDALQDFLDQTGLPSQSDRTQVVGFGRSEAQKAVWTGKQFVKTTEISYNEAVAQMRADIRNGKQVLTLIPQLQAPHLANSAAPGRSYIIGEMEDAQQLVDRYAGTGRFEKDGRGQFTKKEVIQTDMPTGVAVYPNGDTISTMTFKIHYRKTGTHIVPQGRE